jgi:hypothetical protein
MPYTITLEWIPTKALIDWANAQFYYLPEAVAQGNLEPWGTTLQELVCALGERDYSVFLDIHPNDTSHLCTDSSKEHYEDVIPDFNIPYQIGNDYYIKTKAAVFKLDTSSPTPIWMMVKPVQA